MSQRADAQADPQAALVAAMRGGAAVTPELVNSYYTQCIPFYREFLGDHWHTGFYLPGGGAGPQDQLRMERVVADSAGLDPACHALDVGCGVGGAACHLARVTGASIRGLTPNPAQLALARESALRHSVPQVGFDMGDASELPYPDASFDVVLFFESACHFPDRARFFAEAWRVLKPGGRLAGQDWMAGEALPAARRQPLVDRICAAWAIPSLDTVSGYAGLMRSAGFDVLLALDMREEMDLLRGFMATPAEREEVARELCRTGSPIRRMIMEGLMVLGEAAERGAFTVGRLLALKPATP
jgi:tocopherol O-methyltransferase